MAIKTYTLHDSNTAEEIGVATPEQVEASLAAGDTGHIAIDSRGRVVEQPRNSDRRVYVMGGKNPAAVAMGLIKSKAKAISSAVNGTKGGRPAGLYVARVLGSNGSPAYATATIDGKQVTICGSGRVDNSGGVICYQDGEHAGKPVIFRGARAASEAACACHWNNQRYAYDVARGVNRADGVELAGASEGTSWRSCQEN